MLAYEVPYEDFQLSKIFLDQRAYFWLFILNGERERFFASAESKI